jgi:tetratricopeptide (TPR) repeat protein
MLRIRALNILGWLLYVYDHTRMKQVLLESIALCRSLGPEANGELSWALWNLGENAKAAAEHETGCAYMSESVALARQLPPTPLNLWYRGIAEFKYFTYRGELPTLAEAESVYDLFCRSGDPWSAHGLLLKAVVAAIKYLDLEKSSAYISKAFALFQEVHDENGISDLYAFEYWIFSSLGIFPRAIRGLKRWLEFGYNHGGEFQTIHGVVGLAEIVVNVTYKHFAEKKHLAEWGATLYGAVEGIKGMDWILHSNHDSALELLPKLLDEEALNSAWERGKGLSLGETTKLALDFPEYEFASSGEENLL